MNDRRTNSSQAPDGAVTPSGSAERTATFGLEELKRQLIGQPPPGLNEQDILGFFARNQARLIEALAAQIEAAWIASGAPAGSADLRRVSSDASSVPSPSSLPSALSVPTPLDLQVKKQNSVLKLTFVPVLMPAVGGPVYTAEHRGSAGERTGTSITFWNEWADEDTAPVFVPSWNGYATFVGGPLAPEVVEALIARFKPEAAEFQVRERGWGELELRFWRVPTESEPTPVRPKERIKAALLLNILTALDKGKPFKLRVRASKQNYRFLITPDTDSIWVRLQPSRNQGLPLNTSEKKIPRDRQGWRSLADALLAFLPVAWPDVEGGELVDVEED